MMSDTVAMEMELCGVRSPLAVGGVNTIWSVNAQYVDVTICGIHESKSYDLLGVPCVPRRPNGTSSLPDSLELNKCPHFNDVTFVTVSHSRCDMILGVDRMDIIIIIIIIIIQIYMALSHAEAFPKINIHDKMSRQNQVTVRIQVVNATEDIK